MQRRGQDVDPLGAPATGHYIRSASTCRLGEEVYVLSGIFLFNASASQEKV
jgi:hypothetical protein